jgi:hypothetical protein
MEFIIKSTNVCKFSLMMNNTNSSRKTNPMVSLCILFQRNKQTFKNKLQERSGHDKNGDYRSNFIVC